MLKFLPPAESRNGPGVSPFGGVRCIAGGQVSSRDLILGSELSELSGDTHQGIVGVLELAVEIEDGQGVVIAKAAVPAHAKTGPGIVILQHTDQIVDGAH